MKFIRKPHPNSADHEIIEFNTKVHHQLCIPKGLSDKEIVEEIIKYLKGHDIDLPDGGKEHIKGYEDYYPETKLEEVSK